MHSYYNMNVSEGRPPFYYNSQSVVFKERPPHLSIIIPNLFCQKAGHIYNIQLARVLHGWPQWPFFPTHDYEMLWSV